MKSLFGSWLVCFLLLLYVHDADFGNSKNKVLSRKKRYLTFPEGSSLSVAVCMTAQTWVYPPGIFSESLAWGLAFELPNSTNSLKELYGSKNYLKRRHRRDLYGKMETVMNSMGYDGRTCIMRSLCEASQRFGSNEENLLNHILKIVFGFPQNNMLPTEPEDHRIYYRASQIENEDCSQIYSCPFSLINMALGEYSHNVI